jgi:integrase
VAKHRRRGEGSIYRTEVGPPDRRRTVWRAAVLLPSGKRKYLRGGTEKEVIRKLQEVQRDLTEGRPPPSAERLDALLTTWLQGLEVEVQNGDRSPNAVDNASWAVKKWISPHLGAIRLRDLDVDDVERLLGEMVTAGKSRRSVTLVRGYLAQALDEAQRRRKISWNPARIAAMPITRAPQEGRSLTPDEARRLLQAGRGHRLEGLVFTAMTTGLRPGELTGLRWSDVDLDAHTLTVEVSRKHERGSMRLGTPKTERSRRTVGLPEPTVQALRLHRDLQLDERKTARRAWHDLDLVFTTEVGTAIDPSNLRAQIRRLCQRADIEPVTPNELGRHTAASLLHDAGVSLEEIADLLGHRSTRMLEEHYRHRVRPSVDVAVEPMAKLFEAP